MSKLSVRNVYFTPVKKRTSIGDSSRSRIKIQGSYINELEDKGEYNYAT